uniref:BHLH domain-containing protein n=1 Tax=Sparus aurata TaxID=8175 RepID=A0A671VJQ5_SPAAU
MRSDSDRPSTWTPHTSTPYSARIHSTHGSPARVRCVNEGHAWLRKHLPQELEDKRLSKVETLRVAIYYINRENSLLYVSKETTAFCDVDYLDITLFLNENRGDGGPTKPLSPRV